MKHVSRKQIHKRVILSFWLCCIVIVAIVIRLGYVQFVIGDDVTEKAEDSWLRDIEFQADRGDILDKNGEVLSKSVSTPSVILIPQQIKNKQDTANNLSDILGLTEKEAYNYGTKKASTVSVDAFYIAKDSKRYYPNDRFLSHVLEFTGIDNQGLMGLELEYDDKLEGSEGSLNYYSDAKGRKIPDTSYNYQQPKDGLHLKTTIDLDVQTIIERE